MGRESAISTLQAPVGFSHVAVLDPGSGAIGTYTLRLAQELTQFGARVDVVAPLSAGSPSSGLQTIRDLSHADLAVISHDFDIFGGPDGEEILGVFRALRTLRTPTVAILHNVVHTATSRESEILREIARLSDHAVVLTPTARHELLRMTPGLEPNRVSVIAPGAVVADNVWRDGLIYANPAARLLTWGPFRSGSGIEHVIDALGQLHSEGHLLPYTIATGCSGASKREVERYRDRLARRAEDAGIRELVTFDHHTRSAEELADFVADSSLVILPGESTDTAAMTTLAASLAAGRPVIARSRPHCLDLLRTRAGLLVSGTDASAWADAIRDSTVGVSLLAEMTAAARTIAPSFAWHNVARAFLDVATTRPRTQELALA